MIRRRTIGRPKHIYLGSDHAGFKLKEKIKTWLAAEKIPHEDLGNLKYDKNDDYPDFAAKVGRAVAGNAMARNKTETRGILFCGSAEGVCIAANKIRGVRAANPGTIKLVKLSREHNDANILCLSGWFSTFPAAVKIIKVFLKTPFSQAPRHLRRLNKIKQLEKN